MRYTIIVNIDSNPIQERMLQTHLSHQPEIPKIHKRLRRQRFSVQFFRLLLLMLAGWFVLLLLIVGQMIASALNLRAAVFEASEHFQTLAFESTQQDLEKANRSLTDLQKSFYFLTQIWFLPGLKGDFEQMESFFNASRQLTESLTTLLTLGQDLKQLAGLDESTLMDLSSNFSPNVTFGDLSSETKQAILQRFSRSSSDLQLLSTRISLVSQEADAVRVHPLIGSLLDSLNPYLAQLDVVGERLKTMALFAELVPEFFGLGQERTHLLLFLNNDELRPGGGFIGTYGLMRVKNADVLSLQTKDSYAIDRLVETLVTSSAPEPMNKYNATPTLFFRDGNWSPDFAVSAQEVIALFEKESSLIQNHPDVPTSIHVDSVIGFTPTLASALLAYLGPVEIAGQTFTSENVPELIEYEVEKGFETKGILYEDRKEILSQLVVVIQDRLTSLPFSKWSDIFTLFSQTVQSKQLAIFSTNAKVQEQLMRSQWTGSIDSRTVDTQLFVDANFASLKSDPLVTRSLHYEIFRNPSGTWIGRTTMTYRHEGTIDWRTTRYRTYARLYLPKGSELIRVQGLQDGPFVSEDLNMSVIEGFSVIEPGQTHSLVYEYRLSDGVIAAIAKQDYALTFFKQMGARDYTLTLDLDFDKNLTHAMPPENKNQWGDDRYQLNTKLSQNFVLQVGL